MADNDAIEAIVDAAMGTDDQLVKAAQELTSIAINEIHMILKFGTPAAKQQILRSFVPAMIKAGQTQGEDAEMAEMRKNWAKFRDEVAGYEPPDSEEAVSA